MMFLRHFILFIIFVSGPYTFAQNKYLTKTGHVTFEASVPSFEEVKATNKAVTAITNTENNEFAALVLIKGFRFKNALMEEHFNESYAESNLYPKATFKGNIEATHDGHVVSGELTFHGKSKRLENIPISYSKVDGHINISGRFTVNVSDFNIKIPKIVQNKVSEHVNVSLEFHLIPK